MVVFGEGSKDYLWIMKIAIFLFIGIFLAAAVNDAAEEAGTLLNTNWAAFGKMLFFIFGSICAFHTAVDAARKEFKKD